MEFTSAIERRANEARNLEAFTKLSLYAVKDAVAKLLETVGRDGIFGAYTRHDISHVDKLLSIMEWMIPPSTFLKMTAADCLMVTLAVYFHDLGMVVTREEFAMRSQSGFPSFKTTELFAGEKGKDYEEKVAKMDPDEAERFLYQEFVRTKHAERIRFWIVGKSPRDLGIADQVVTEIDALLDGLGGKFRKDLGLICESHHLDDLEDLGKYKPSQPYGPGPQETANLQYCAILLRAADLLHVTNDRAPSISFRIINPSDPKSIEEWRKQMAVVTVRPKPGVDKDGNVDLSMLTDTVEVHGFFTEPEGFFALTAYLIYARKELRRCRDWAETGKRKKSSVYEFPWASIDDSGLETEGFVDRQFEFTLDQAKILDLLTGHTLYNDTGVVLRELIQNSLDAIRLQWEVVPGFINPGLVQVAWDSSNRVLTVSDNGTGMSQQTIDEHFLKVGSSRYQDEEFKKTSPSI